MGYMGFGMRKKVYTRKPKRVFQRKKQLEKPIYHSEVSETHHAANETYQKIRFIPMYQRKWFWLSGVLIILLIITPLIANNLNKETQAADKLNQFHETGISEYYEQKASLYDSIFQYLAEREGRLHRIKNNYPGVYLSIRSANYPPNGRRNHLSSSIFEEEPLPEIIDGDLHYVYYESAMVFKDYWSFTLKISNVSEIQPAYIAHLQTDALSLNQILVKLAKHNLQVTANDKGIAIDFPTFDGRYVIAKIENIHKLKASYQQQLHHIKDKLYWARQTDLENLF